MLLTVFPGHEGLGEVSVCPRMITRDGAESAASGRAKATRAASAQARQRAAAARFRCFRLSVAVSKTHLEPCPGGRVAARFSLDAPANARRHADLHNPGQEGAAVGPLGLPADMDDAPDRGGDFIAGGLAGLGVDADETELGVIAGVHRVF